MLQMMYLKHRLEHRMKVLKVSGECVHVSTTVLCSSSVQLLYQLTLALKTLSGLFVCIN